MHVDYENGRMDVLGEVNKRFIATPDVSTLLEQINASSVKSDDLIGEGLISMDTS